MKPLHPNLLATRISLTEVGERGVPGNRSGEANRRSHPSSRPLVAKAVAKRHAGQIFTVVSQPWHTSDNSAPDTSRGQISSERIQEVALDSQQPDRCLTGEHTAEGWASRLDISRAAVASGDAKSFPQVRVLESELRRASHIDVDRSSNLLP